MDKSTSTARERTEVLTMRLIDGDAILKADENSDKALVLGSGKSLEIAYALLKKKVEDAPTVDAVVVTRCKDCEHAERYERADGTAGYYCGCPQNTFTYGERWDRVFKPAKEADDFCSYGERKRE